MTARPIRIRYLLGVLMARSSCLVVLALYLISITSAQQQQDGRCDVTREVVTYTRCMNCLLNTFASCPSGTNKTSTGQGLNDCTYRVFIFRFPGCRHSCQSTVVTEARCCDGYWGTNCDRECIQLQATYFLLY